MYVCMNVYGRLVGDKYIEFSNGERLNYGFCVWAAGNGPIPFVLNTIEKVKSNNSTIHTYIQIIISTSLGRLPEIGSI